MKNMNKIFLVAAVASSLVFTSCLDEVQPTSGATQEQVDASAKATEAMLYGMPAALNFYETVTDQHYDWGYGSIMHIRDVMTEEYAVVQSNYNWYSSWCNNQYQGEGYLRTQFIWNYFWKLVQTTNKMVGQIKADEKSDLLKGFKGAGHAFRAFAYLDLARMYEFLPNDATNGQVSDTVNVTNYTVPIVTEATTEEQARNNPRVTREAMAKFIQADLDTAEAFIPNFSRRNKTLPNLAVVYGLKARLYMWLENYPEAEKYARMAINESGATPLTKDEWLSTSNGFNNMDVSSWMFASGTVKEEDVVQSGIVNWTSWCSNEAEFGYAAAGPFSMVGAAFYNKISNADFRKLSWKAPEGHPLYGKNTFIDPSWAEQSLPDYASVKFRPGQGNYEEYSVGAAVAYPLMRVEEMYFIEAEAAAHQDAARGKALLTTFMKDYRYGSYSCKAEDKEGIIDEIFLQKRIELWGEGLSFFDYKRLNKPVTRRYTGTNFPSACRFNTTTRPAWMNFVAVQTEANNNKAYVGWNNPDPSGKYSTTN